MKKSTKKQTKRSKAKYPNLSRNLNLKARRDYIETYYTKGVPSVTGEGEGIRELTEDEKEWLNKFYGEYVNASFKKGGDHLHDTEELRRDCYSKNNSRNRCLYNQTKKVNKLSIMPNELLSEIIDDNYEESLNGLEMEHLIVDDRDLDK